MQFVFPSNIEPGQDQGEGFHQELLRGLTHKLNNQLAVIQGFSSLILMMEQLDPTIRENVQHIRDASGGVSQMSERIRSAGGCAQVSLQSLQLSDYLGLIQAGLAEVAQKAGVPLDFDIQPGLPPVVADPAKLKEVLTELLRNAVEAALQGNGRVMMRVCGPGVITPEAERRVDILVSNTGATIPPEKLPDIFRPFHGNKSTDHLGLGLTVAAMLSHQMKIQLGAASENQTTTLWLSLPSA